MGWCNGTGIFDVVAKHVTKKHLDREKLLEELIEEMWHHDWDCETDSEYIKHPLVRKVFLKLNPDMFDYENE